MLTDALYDDLPIVLVDDDPSVLFATRALLRTYGFAPIIVLEDSRDLLPLLEREAAALVIIDLMMPHLSGLQLLPEISQYFPDVPVMIMTASQELEIALQCMKNGALDYLVKPVEESHLIANIKRVLAMNVMKRQLRSLKNTLLAGVPSQQQVFASILTRSHKMQAIFQYAEAVAPSREPVLVTGETGVGKESMIQAIHDLSGRTGKLIAVNVAGLDDHLLSDALFGHKRGAFSGADIAREGLIAQAVKGSLFLDEIGDLSAVSQVKLLRLLQDGSYFPLGADTSRRSDARVLCATNRDLPQLVREGKFRQDLYYRLATHQIHLPPLRERREDLPLLLGNFLEEASQALGKSTPTPPPELLHLLAVYPFPGNIRELKAMVTDAVAQHKSRILSMANFEKIILHQPIAAISATGTLEEACDSLLPDPLPTLQSWSDCLVKEALKRSGGNQRIAATMLDISRHTVMRWEQAQREKAHLKLS